MRSKRSKQPLNTALKPPSDITTSITVKRPMPANMLPTDAQRSGEMGGEGAIRGTGTVSKTLSANARDEYVSAGGYVWLPKYIKALPFYIDDTTRDFGDDLYERMLLDPQISACIMVLKGLVLDQGVTLTPVEDEEQEVPSLGTAGTTRTVKASSDLSKEICEFCKRNLFQYLVRPIHEVLYEMMDALALGNKIAEQVYDDGEGPDEGKLILKALKIKPRRSYSFVVDVYFNVLGVIGLIPGQGARVIVESIIGQPDQIPNLLPRTKFALLTNRGQQGDPRGQSDLRCVYNAWWLKMQLQGEYLKYLTQFASPSLWGETPEGAQKYLDDAGNSISPEKAMTDALIGIKNGSVASVPHGGKINTLEMKGAGEPFQAALGWYDNQITKGILTQTLATEEGAHQARAAAETHQDILGLRPRVLKGVLQSMLKKDVLYELVFLNYGKKAADALTPNVTLGETEHQDFAQDATAISNLASKGVLHVSQYPGIDQMLGLPERDVEAQNAELLAEQKALNAQQLAQAEQQQTDRALARQQADKTAGRLGAEMDD